MLPYLSQIDLVLPALGVVFVITLIALRALKVRRKTGPTHSPDASAGRKPAASGPLSQLSIEGTSEGVWQWDLQTNVFRTSPGWAEILGWEPSDIGDNVRDWFALVHPYYLSGLRMDLAAHLQGKSERFECEYRIRHRDGNYRWVLCRGRVIEDEQGEAIAIAGVQTDVTRLIEVENRLIEDALHDRLTGLPNRNFFTAQLAQAIEAARTSPIFQFAVLFLDLDRFKEINDTLGHLVGDKLLAATAKRLRACVRPEDCVARFGGDEFIVLLERVDDFDEAQTVAERIGEALDEPFELEGHSVVTSASTGIVLSSSQFDDAEDLVRNADLAMYEAKAAGKGRSRVYDRTMYERTRRRWNLENDLRRAIEREELLLHYQPQICLKSGRILGAEALLRWNGPDGEKVGPAEFIPLAERSDLILDLGEWVLRRACAEARSWNRGSRSHWAALKVSVNVSGRQLKEPGFSELVERVLSDTGLDPRNLELELTETVMIDSLNDSPAVVAGLARMGIGIAIDDFGTGYSSISYLTKLKASVIKLDRSFIIDVGRKRLDAALVTGVIGLAHGLGLTVIAEGVEEKPQIDFLQSNRCDLVQGYLTGRPMPEESFHQLLAEETAMVHPGAHDHEGWLTSQV